MKRRDFLNYSLLAASTQLLPMGLFMPRARADGNFLPSKSRFFVLVRMTSGWDVTLGLDPKVHANGSTQDDMFIEYAPGDILDASGVKLGPAAESLMKHKGDFSVVNGLISATSDNGHQANLEYLSSGSGDGKAPHLPIEIAVASGKGPIGLVFNGSPIALDRDVMLSSIESVQSLKNSLNMTDFGDFIRAGKVSDAFKAAQISMLDNGEEIKNLVARLGSITETDTAKITPDVIAASFASGASLQAQWDITDLNLDTHSSHEKAHLIQQKMGWERISNLFDVFKQTNLGDGVSLFDRTVFMVISEFSRTPALNGAKGKDHNPLTNSVLLAGGGINGGKVVGESHLITLKRSTLGVATHSALPMDFATLKTVKTRKEAEAGSYKYIVPETITATIANAMQVDWKKFRSIDASTPALTSLIKSGW
jgi:hypothetical protein